MKLKQIGRYFELPIVGQKIKKILFDGLLTLVFDDSEESFLEIHSEFKVSQYNQNWNFRPSEKEAFIAFFDLYGQEIKEAKADSNGNLWVVFENNCEISIEDGPFENWHYTKKSKTKSTDNLYVHGGVGKTLF